MNSFFSLPPDIWFIITELLSLHDLSTLYKTLTSASASTVTHVRTVTFIHATKVFIITLTLPQSAPILISKAMAYASHKEKIEALTDAKSTVDRYHLIAIAYIQNEDITQSFHLIPNRDTVSLTLTLSK